MTHSRSVYGPCDPPQCVSPFPMFIGVLPILENSWHVIEGGKCVCVCVCVFEFSRWFVFLPQIQGGDPTGTGKGTHYTVTCTYCVHTNFQSGQLSGLYSLLPMWYLCEYIIVHTKWPPSPVILWIGLGGKPKWLPLNFGYNVTIHTGPIELCLTNICSDIAFRLVYWLGLCLMFRWWVSLWEAIRGWVQAKLDTLRYVWLVSHRCCCWKLDWPLHIEKLYPVLKLHLPSLAWRWCDVSLFFYVLCVCARVCTGTTCACMRLTAYVCLPVWVCTCMCV